MLHLIPRPVHRALLKLAHPVRHRWRRWRKTPLAGCSVLLFDLSDQVLLLRHNYGPALWSLPGGGIGKAEAPADAAKREVSEELNIALDTLASLGTMQETISGSLHTAHVFFARIDQSPCPDGREVREARFFPMHSLPADLSDLTRARLALWQDRMSSPTG